MRTLLEQKCVEAATVDSAKAQPIRCKNYQNWTVEFQRLSTRHFVLSLTDPFGIRYEEVDRLIVSDLEYDETIDDLQIQAVEGLSQRLQSIVQANLTRQITIEMHQNQPIVLIIPYGLKGGNPDESDEEEEQEQEQEQEAGNSGQKRMWRLVGFTAGVAQVGGGVALSILSGGLLSVAGSSLISSGINGCTLSVTAEDEDYTVINFAKTSAKGAALGAIGASVGAAVGAGVNCASGLVSTGTQVATQAGTQVATQAGAQVATQAATQVGTQVAAQAGTQVVTQTATQVGAQLASQAATQATAEAAAQLAAQAAARAAAEAASQTLLTTTTVIAGKMAQDAAVSTLSTVGGTFAEAVIEGDAAIIKQQLTPANLAAAAAVGAVTGQVNSAGKKLAKKGLKAGLAVAQKNQAVKEVLEKVGTQAVKVTVGALSGAASGVVTSATGTVVGNGVKMALNSEDKAENAGEATVTIPTIMDIGQVGAPITVGNKLTQGIGAAMITGGALGFVTGGALAAKKYRDKPQRTKQKKAARAAKAQQARLADALLALGENQVLMEEMHANLSELKAALNVPAEQCDPVMLEQHAQKQQAMIAKLNVAYAKLDLIQHELQQHPTPENLGILENIESQKVWISDQINRAEAQQTITENIVSIAKSLHVKSSEAKLLSSQLKERQDAFKPLYQDAKAKEDALQNLKNKAEEINRDTKRVQDYLDKCPKLINEIEAANQKNQQGLNSWQHHLSSLEEMATQNQGLSIEIQNDEKTLNDKQANVTHLRGEVERLRRNIEGFLRNPLATIRDELNRTKDNLAKARDEADQFAVELDKKRLKLTRNTASASKEKIHQARAKIKEFQEVIDNNNVTITQIKNKAGEVLEKQLKPLQEARETLEYWRAFAEKNLLEARQAANEFASKYVNELAQGVVEAQKIADAAHSTIASLGNEAQSGIQHVSEGMRHQVAVVNHTAVNLAQNLNQANHLVADATRAVANGAQQLAGATAKVSQSYAQVVENAAKTAEKIGKDIRREAKTMGGDIAKTAKTAIRDISREAKTTGGDIAKTAKTAVRDIRREGKTAGGDIAKTAKTAVRDISREGKTAARDIAKTGKTACRDTGRFFKKAANDIQQETKPAAKLHQQAYNRFYNIVKNEITKLVDEIKKNPQLYKMVDVVKNPIAAIKLDKFTLKDIEKAFNKAGYDISAEWKRLPEDARTTITVVAVVVAAYYGGSLFFSSGGEVAILLETGVGTLKIASLTAAGIELLPGLVAVYSGYEAYERAKYDAEVEKYRNSPYKDYPNRGNTSVSNQPTPSSDPNAQSSDPVSDPKKPQQAEKKPTKNSSDHNKKPAADLNGKEELSSPPQRDEQHQSVSPSTNDKIDLSPQDFGIMTPQDALGPTDLHIETQFSSGANRPKAPNVQDRFFESAPIPPRSRVMNLVNIVSLINDWLALKDKAVRGMQEFKIQQLIRQYGGCDYDVMTNPGQDPNRQCAYDKYLEARRRAEAQGPEVKAKVDAWLEELRNKSRPQDPEQLPQTQLPASSPSRKRR